MWINIGPPTREGVVIFIASKRDRKTHNLYSGYFQKLLSEPMQKKTLMAQQSKIIDNGK